MLMDSVWRKRRFTWVSPATRGGFAGSLACGVNPDNQRKADTNTRCRVGSGGCAGEGKLYARRRTRPDAISRTWFRNIARCRPSSLETAEAISARNGSAMMA